MFYTFWAQFTSFAEDHKCLCIFSGSLSIIRHFLMALSSPHSVYHFYSLGVFLKLCKMLDCCAQFKIHELWKLVRYRVPNSFRRFRQHQSNVDCIFLVFASANIFLLIVHGFFGLWKVGKPTDEYREMIYSQHSRNWKLSISRFCTLIFGFSFGFWFVFAWL